MIKKITLINFQVHKKLELEVHPRFNVWVGSNDSGKSSIIRAIYWVFYNEPSGDWMQRIDRKGNKRVTTVKILFSDDTLIIRKKGNGKNIYTVDGEPYQNFGYSIPEQVKEILKIYPLQTNKEVFNINVAMQEEKPFLIHESGPARASVLDVLTGNSLIQKAISSFGKESLAKSKEVTSLEASVTEDEEALKNMPDIDKADRLSKEAESKENLIKEKLLPELQELQNLSVGYAEYSGIIEDLNKFMIDLSPIEELLEDRQQKIGQINELEELGRKHNSLNEAIIELPDLSNIVKLISKSCELSLELEELKTLYKDNSDLNEELDAAKILIKQTDKELSIFYKENKACPTCDKVW